MEEKLNKLLEDLKNQETKRKDKINEINIEIGRLNSREQSEIERFTENMRADIASGWYNNKAEGYIQQLIEEAKNEIQQRYEAERNQLNQKMEDAQKKEEISRANDYKQINSGIKEYHTDMVLEATKAKRELTSIEAERNQKLQEIEKRIAEQEAKQTHMIMQNRKFMEIESTQISADIRLLGIEIEKLKTEKESISSEYASKIEAQNEYLQYCTEQKERAAKFLGKISLSDKSIYEIQQILFEGAEPVVVEEQPEEVVEEEQPVEVVEEQQPEEVVEEEQPIEIVEEEQPVVVEEEQPIEVVEEQPVVEVKEAQPEEVVKKEPAKVIEKAQPIVAVAQPAITKAELPIVEDVQQIIEEVEEIIRPKTVSEQDRNYKYFENNSQNIIKFFMMATGIKENEAKEIFANKEHCTAVGEMCRKAMQKQNRDRDELISRLEDYYLGIDSELDIEVSAKGIRYNHEKIEPLDVTQFGNIEIQFIDKIIWKYKDTIPKFKNDPDNVVYDKNIIIAIAMDNCKDGNDNNLKLTASGKKKLNQYLNLIANPNYDKGTVTYDLQKMSVLKGFFNYSAWPAETVREFREIAHKVKDTYADVIPGFISKAQWAIKDWFERIKTKKLTSGEQEISVQKSNKGKNLWRLQELQKAYANSRNKDQKVPKVSEPEKEECK